MNAYCRGKPRELLEPESVKMRALLHLFWGRLERPFEPFTQLLTRNVKVI